MTGSKQVKRSKAKRWVRHSITVDEALYKRIGRAAEREEMSRSAFFRKGAKRLLEELNRDRSER
jgi:metal-responsive CopG/Arc/MetJ family transcriptional regulator